MKPVPRHMFAAVFLVLSFISITNVVAQDIRVPRNTIANADVFIANVDLTSLGKVAVQTSGRMKSLDSYTNTMIHLITGPHLIDGQSRTFTYFDMIFRQTEYADKDVIHIHKKVIRQRIYDAIMRQFENQLASDLSSRLNTFLKTGLISDQLLNQPEVVEELRAMNADLIKTAKFVQQIETARAVMNPQNLLFGLKMVPHPTAGVNDPWLSIDEYAFSDFTDVPGFDINKQTALREALENLVQGWRTLDAMRVNTAADKLAEVLPTINTALYPKPYRAGWPWSVTEESLPKWIGSSGVLSVLLAGFVAGIILKKRILGKVSLGCSFIVIGLSLFAILLGRYDYLALESFYFNNLSWFTANWILYLFSIVFLLMSIVYKWSFARHLGMSIFVIAFAYQSSGLLIRWCISDRFPNSNMFEAVTTAAWFSGCCAIILEIIVHRHPMRNVFALGSAVASMTALMAVHFLPQSLDSNISNAMPVLNDIWLYIHTNVIIFSYGLIFMASIPALLYAINRVIGSIRGIDGTDQFARVGGAGSLIMTRPDGSTYLASQKSSLGQVLDGATMILMELAFVLLWTGIAMGAMWADHSWGRPWGWDPKEVFALNTFIVFVVLIHVRMKTKDKGMWTSLLVLVGCVVMLFNWIFINFKIAGLHSYA